MKKLLTAVLSLSLLGAAALPALAVEPETPEAVSPGTEVTAPAPEETQTAQGFSIEIDGTNIDARAHVMVPLRAVAEALGFTVTWDNGEITVTGQERYAQLTIGKDEYFAAPTQEGMMGASLFSLGCAPYAVDGRTYVPVELFDALLGCQEGTAVLEENRVKISTDPGSMGAVQIPNPFTSHATLSEASKAAGFELAVPEQVSGSPRRDIQTMDGMIQVFYGGEDDSVCIRKARGSEDISGDSNAYSETAVVDANGISVTMKGENGLVYLAIWTSGGYTYAISARAGLSHAGMAALVGSVR